MAGADHQHAQAALADAAADGEGQLPGEQHLVEGQGATVVAAPDAELAVHGGLVHPDAHGGDFKAALQHRIPEQDVAVQRPVVVVGGPAVVGLAGALQRAADLHEEHGVVFPADGVLPLFGGQVGPAVLQLLGGYEVHLPIQLGVQGGEGDLQGVVGLTDGGYDGAHRLAEIILRPILPADDLLPVPLVHVDGVGVVHLLVPADGVHIGEQALAHVEAIPLQGQALPLGQGMHHLAVDAHVGNIEGDRALHAVQIIVQAGILIHKEGGGYPAQIQRLAQVDLEIALDELDGTLHLIGVQRRLISCGNVNLAHASAPLLYKIWKSL